MEDEPLQVGITGEKRKEEVLCWIKTPLEEWAFGLVCWVGFTDDGSEERLFNVVWEAAAGGTSFWGAARARQELQVSLGKDFAAAKTSGCKVAGFHFSPTRKLFTHGIALSLNRYLTTSSVGSFPCLAYHCHLSCH